MANRACLGGIAIGEGLPVQVAGVINVSPESFYQGSVVLEEDRLLRAGEAMGIKWREIEVRRERGQAPTIVLTGQCRAIALAKGGSRVILSLTHDGDYALAQAMLLGDSADDASDRE